MIRGMVAAIFILPLLVLAIGCSRYPSIPDVEKLNKEATIRDNSINSKDKLLEISDIQKTERIGEVFEKKAIIFFGKDDRTDKDYIIGPEDVLKIQVWDNEDLDRTVYVSREGEFSYPLIGMVLAEYLTVADLEKEIIKRLSEGYLLNPQVSITVKEYTSKRVYVMGEVGGPQGGGKGPGTYPLTGQTITLLEIISNAGGLTREAGDIAFVIRPLNNKKNSGPILPREAKKGEVIKVNLRDLLEKGDATQNVVLKHLDTILVPKGLYFYVFGEVNNPGRYSLVKGTTVLKAITIAGGVSRTAAANRTVLVREQDGERIKRPATMGDKVQAEDIIIVPESRL